MTNCPECGKTIYPYGMYWKDGFFIKNYECEDGCELCIVTSRYYGEIKQRECEGVKPE